MKTLQFAERDTDRGKIIDWRGYLPEDPSNTLALITLVSEIGHDRSYNLTGAMMDDDAELESDFASFESAEAAANKVMNDWIANHTNGWKGGGVGLIAAERARQVSQEGWTSEHDDEHTCGELALAASCYAERGLDGRFTSFPHYRWPWERAAWKPSTDRIRDLTKAGALIAAEIDRLQRLRDYDPTPYCAVCGARTAADCTCPP